MPHDDELSATNTLEQLELGHAANTAAAAAGGTGGAPDAAGGAERAEGGTGGTEGLPDGQAPRPAGFWRLAAEAAGVYALLQALTFAMLLPLRVGEDTFFGDVLIGWFGPEKHATAGFLTEGVLPTWVRSQFAGEPYIANLQHAVFYPGNLPFWVLPTSTAMKAVIAGHLAFAGLAMWAYCRVALRAGPWGAAIAGVCFGLGGFTLAHVTLLNQLQVLAWMPLVLLGGHLVLERGKLRHVVLAAVFTGMQFLAGHPEEWVYTLYALALYGVVWALARGWPRPGGLGAWARRTAGGALKLAASLVLFVLLFGYQLFPTLVLQSEGWRNAPTFDQQYELPVHQTINSLLPDYGRILTGENVGFVGVAGLLLAALGVVAGRRDLRWVRIWIGVLALLGLAMAVGGRSPLYAFLYERVSLVSDFRVPARWLQLTYFALAAGAALGTDALLRRGAVRPLVRLREAAAAGVALVVLFGLAAALGNATIPHASWLWWLAAAAATGIAWLAAAVRGVPRVLVALLLVVTASAEVARARQQAEFNQAVPGIVYDDPGPLLTRIGQDQGSQVGRYVSVADLPRTPEDRDLIQVPSSLDDRQRNYYLVAFTRNLIGRPALQYMTGAETITGRDGGLMPTREYTEFAAATIGAGGQFTAGLVLEPPSRWNFETLDFLGVRWFVTPGMGPDQVQVMVDNGFSISDRIGHVLLWGRPRPPLARMHYDTVDVIADPGERLARLAEDYPLTERAVVEEPVGEFTPPATPPTVETTDRTTAAGQTRVDVHVETDTRGLLVLADPWYPGWAVEVDGEPAELVRVNHAFRGVVVPSGGHEVTFTYTDRLLQAGFAAAALTVLGLAAAGVLSARRRRRARDAGRAGDGAGGSRDGGGGRGAAPSPDAPAPDPAPGR